ncbi:MAG: YbhB/YbcL family Raf kinase inhibitor-like protein [Actinobacteria bacterium]|nr:MAG: YbhB/YbcL family Raf kinase inhibitor-like protein [Actinomycetota bacterium]REK36426.1 MAG: YbhB/YbcL family Raf kinase inhibitor-like protein [Actinomycetota bacterium]
MWLRSNDFEDGAQIPGDNSLCIIDPEAHVTFSANKSPHLEWGDVPEGTKSFALLMIDVDVPSSGEDVNQEGREVPEDLPRTDFSHWVMVDIPADTRSFESGQFSDGVTEGGKPGLSGRPREGVNDYTSWFEGDSTMGGTYKGYDGPCPPWNDSIVHHYHVRLHALDVPQLELQGDFTAADVQEAMEGHSLAEAVLVGLYTLNPRLAGSQ